MQITTDKDGLRRVLAAKQCRREQGRNFATGVAVIDDVAPNGSFQGGAVHELLLPRRDVQPKSFALLLAAAAHKSGGAIAWSDPEQDLHLPALSAVGIDLRRVVLLRCKNRADQLWAGAECLRCRGVAATVAYIERLSQIEARRLQLAAERGGGIGVFMRPQIPGITSCYAAATRWLIQPAPGNDQMQRWSVHLLHGHGGQIGKVLLLEVDREHVLCVYLRHWPIDRLRRRQPELLRKAVVLVETVGNRQTVVHASPETPTEIYPGMTLAAARARHSALINLPVTPAVDLRSLEALGYWLMRFSPHVCIHPPSTIFLDATGLDRLFSGLDNLQRKVADALIARFGSSSR